MGSLKLSIFRNHPQGAKSVFLAQAFFNFGFFGFKSLIVLYTIDHYAFKEQDAIDIFATLMALSYATSLIGGYLADKLIGPRDSILLGGALSSIGVAILTVNTNAFLAFALLSLGSGCYKPNFSAVLSLLFKDPQDPNKDSAFTVLYVAMNLGSFIGPIICSYASYAYGWVTGFTSVVISYFIGTSLIFYRTKHLKDFIKIPLKEVLQGAALLITSIVALYFLFKYRNYFDKLMGVTIFISFICFSIIFYKSNFEERKGLVTAIPYILLFTIFCALFEQAGSSILLFFDKMVDRQLQGLVIPSSTLLSIDPILVLILGLFVPQLSKTYLERNKALDGLTKFGIGFFFISASFGVLALGASQSLPPISLGWILLAIFLQTIGELFIVPVGFASISKLAPKRYLSLMMSLWLMAISYGHYLAGIVAKSSLNSVKTPVNGDLSNYTQFFFYLSIIPLGIAITLLINVFRKN